MKRYTYAILSLSTLALMYYVSSGKKEPLTDPAFSPEREPAAANISSPSPTRHETHADAWELPVGSTALEVAEDFVRKNRKKLRLQPHHELRPTIMKAPLRTTVIYSIYEMGFPIVGMELSIQTDRHLNLVKVGGNYRPLKPSDFSGLNQIRPQQTAKLVPVRYRVQSHALKNNEPILFATTNSPRAELSYVLDVVDRAPSGRHRHSPKQIVVRASDGQILRSAFPRREFTY